MTDIDTAAIRASVSGRCDAVAENLVDVCDALDAARARLALPCGSCHPCANWRDADWMSASRRHPYPHEVDDLEARAEAAEVHNRNYLRIIKGLEERAATAEARIAAALALKDALEEIVFCELYLDRVGRELVEKFWPMMEAALTGDQK